ncbi:MAG TPA: DNRLRE domain-containing protein, partial [Anaerolineales bacterium]
MNTKVAPKNVRFFNTRIISVLILLFILTVTVLPVKAIPMSLVANPVQNLAAVSTSFVPVIDAYVDSASPTTNYGTLTTLRGDGSPLVHSYLRFNVQGLSGAVTQATLRIFANSSSNGGYNIQGVSDNTWSESTINYNNAPPLGSILGTYGAFNSGVWTSVDVTAYITGNGVYNLALSVPGVTAISFASRESGANAPQLVVVSGSASPATSTPTQPPLPTSTPIQPPLATSTPTTAPAGSLFTFIPNADSYVQSNKSSTNFGSLTTLRVDGSPVVHSYLRFNVQGLSAPVTLATLRVFANTTSNGQTYDIQSVSNNTWGESTITYANAPALGAVIGSSPSFGAGVWTSVNVTAYITGNGSYNLALSERGSSSITFASRESGLNAPQLVIQTGTASQATSTATPVNTLVPPPAPTNTPIAIPTNTPVAIPTNTPIAAPTNTAYRSRKGVRGSRIGGGGKGRVGGGSNGSIGGDGNGGLGG